MSLSCCKIPRISIDLSRRTKGGTIEKGGFKVGDDHYKIVNVSRTRLENRTSQFRSNTTEFSFSATMEMSLSADNDYIFGDLENTYTVDSHSGSGSESTTTTRTDDGNLSSPCPPVGAVTFESNRAAEVSLSQSEGAIDDSASWTGILSLVDDGTGQFTSRAYSAPAGGSCSLSEERTETTAFTDSFSGVFRGDGTPSGSAGELDSNFGQSTWDYTDLIDDIAVAQIAPAVNQSEFGDDFFNVFSRPAMAWNNGEDGGFASLLKIDILGSAGLVGRFIELEMRRIEYDFDSIVPDGGTIPVWSEDLGEGEVTLLSFMSEDLGPATLTEDSPTSDEISNDDWALEELEVDVPTEAKVVYIVPFRWRNHREGYWQYNPLFNDEDERLAEQAFA